MKQIRAGEVPEDFSWSHFCAFALSYHSEFLIQKGRIIDPDGLNILFLRFF